MSEDYSNNEIVCQDCESVPTLMETPYQETDYVVSCDCEQRSVDVSAGINGNSLVHPLSGKWSNIDHDHEKQ